MPHHATASRSESNEDLRSSGGTVAEILRSSRPNVRSYLRQGGYGKTTDPSP